MTKGQKITMWVFGLIISLVLFFWGIGMTDAYGTQSPNIFVALVVPLILIGLMFFFSFNKKNNL
jgi:hypothetical protein